MCVGRAELEQVRGPGVAVAVAADVGRDGVGQGDRVLPGAHQQRVGGGGKIGGAVFLGAELVDLPVHCGGEDEHGRAAAGLRLRGAAGVQTDPAVRDRRAVPWVLRDGEAVSEDLGVCGDE